MKSNGTQKEKFGRTFFAEGEACTAIFCYTQSLKSCLKFVCGTFYDLFHE